MRLDDTLTIENSQKADAIKAVKHDILRTP